MGYTQSATVSYRRGVISGLLMPIVNELCAGLCQKNAHKGTLTLAERAAKEEAILTGTSAPSSGPAPTVLALDSITPISGIGSTIILAGALLGGLSCTLARWPARPWAQDE